MIWDGITLNEKIWKNQFFANLPWFSHFLYWVNSVFWRWIAHGQLRQNTDPSSPIIKSWKTFANLVYFQSNRMYLNEKNKKKWQEKFYEVGPVSAQSDTCFLVHNRSFLNIFTFHLEKYIRKTWNFAIGAYVCVFKRKL
jgi:hypothetical protein